MMEKNKNSKKLTIVLTCLLVIIILAIILICLYLYQSSQNNIVLANDTISIEYGEEYIPSVEDFVELNDEVTLDNTYVEYELKYKEVLDEETGEVVETYTYPEVGEYDITVYHSFDFKLFGITLFTGNINKDAELVVEDTTPPIFSEDVLTEIIVWEGEEITEETLNTIYIVSDYSDVTLSLNDEYEVDCSTSGEYETQVLAIDEYDNVSYIPVTIIVYEYLG